MRAIASPVEGGAVVSGTALTLEDLVQENLERLVSSTGLSGERIAQLRRYVADLDGHHDSRIAICMHKHMRPCMHISDKAADSLASAPRDPYSVGTSSMRSTVNSSPFSATCTRTTSPSVISLDRIARASRSSISCCMSRRSGRAP